jgi:hypothetical protein
MKAIAKAQPGRDGFLINALTILEVCATFPLRKWRVDYKFWLRSSPAIQDYTIIHGVYINFITKLEAL